MKKLIIIISILIFAVADLSAVRYPKHQMGIGYSMIRGGGLEYQIELNQKSALKFSFVTYYFGEEAPDDMQIYVVVGAEYQYNILKEKDYRLYALTAASIWHIEDRKLNEYQINDRLFRERITRLNRMFNAGIGAGFEYNLTEKMVFNISAGAYYQSSYNSPWTDSFFDRDPSGTSFFGLGGGIGLRFRI